MEKLDNQPCPVCRKNTCTMAEEVIDVPYFGKTYLLTMSCTECQFHTSAIEAEESKEPCKYSLEISSPEDLNIRVVKSDQAIVKWPGLRIKSEPGVNAEGYIANVEKMINDLLDILKSQKETEEDSGNRKKLTKLINKILDVKDGVEKTKVVIEDPTGNSMIISDKAVKEKLKK